MTSMWRSRKDTLAVELRGANRTRRKRWPNGILLLLHLSRLLSGWWLEVPNPTGLAIVVISIDHVDGRAFVVIIEVRSGNIHNVEPLHHFTAEFLGNQDFRQHYLVGARHLRLRKEILQIF